MPLVITHLSRNLSTILTSPRILAGLHFYPSERHHPQFLATAGVPKSAGPGKDMVRSVGHGKNVAKLLTASFVWGLRQTRKNGKPKIRVETVRRVVKSFFREGGTIVLQLGWWKHQNEDSARIIIQNRGIPNKTRSGAMSDGEFRAVVDKLIGHIMRTFHQKVIWLDYYRGSRRVSPRKIEWK